MLNDYKSSSRNFYVEMIKKVQLYGIHVQTGRAVPTAALRFLAYTRQTSRLRLSGASFRRMCRARERCRRSAIPTRMDRVTGLREHVAFPGYFPQLGPIDRREQWISGLDCCHNVHSGECVKVATTCIIFYVHGMSLHEDHQSFR